MADKLKSKPKKRKLIEEYVEKDWISKRPKPLVSTYLVCVYSSYISNIIISYMLCILK